MKLTRDKSILRIDRIGSAMPSLVIGGSDAERFVPNINSSFRFGSDSEKHWWNLNDRDVIITNQKPVIDIVDKSASIRVGEVEEKYRIEGVEGTRY